MRGVPLAVISCLSGFLLCLMQNRGHKGQKAGLVLVLAGGISNLYDRCVRRYVVDYANLRFGFLKKVVFNLGDLFVLAGTVLLMILQLSGDWQRQKENAAKIKTVPFLININCNCSGRGIFLSGKAGQEASEIPPM